MKIKENTDETDVTITYMYSYSLLKSYIILDSSMQNFALYICKKAMLRVVASTWTASIRYVNIV